MLEGKEIQGNLGAYGEYSADLDSKGTITVAVGLKLDLVAELKKLAAKTDTPVDDAAIAWVEKVLAVL
jgi:hypothetical protein